MPDLARVLWTYTPPPNHLSAIRGFLLYEVLNSRLCNIISTWLYCVEGHTCYVLGELGMRDWLTLCTIV